MTYEHQPYHHSPEQPTQPTPPQQPRKRRRWPWVVGAVVALGVIGNLLPDTGDDEPAGTHGIAEGAVEVRSEERRVGKGGSQRGRHGVCGAGEWGVKR